MFAQNIKINYKKENTVNTYQNIENGNKEIYSTTETNNSDLVITLNNKDYSLPFDCNALISAYNLKFYGRVSHTLDYRLYNNSGKYILYLI